MELGLVAAVVGLGVIHGVLPDHGWPIAATYALGFDAKWFRGTVAALILGIGHLISSIALVLAYFWVSAFADFAEGPYMKPLAGGLLILLGVYEYASGGHAHDHGHNHEDGEEHNHDTEHSHHPDQDDQDGDQHNTHEHNDSHDHDDHGESHDDHGLGHTHAHGHTHDGAAGWLGKLRSLLPGGGGHAHLTEEHAEQGLYTLGVTALLLGFAHEEPVQILAICAGTELCLELMLIYSIAVIGAILAPTLLLIAGYEHYRERIERFTPYLPTLTAVVLVIVGSWFVLSGIR